MASYDRLVFSLATFKDEMESIFDGALNEAVAEIQKNEWFSGTVPSIMGGDNETYAEVYANSLKAWIVEYGQGKDAEFWRNPYWKDYVESEYTHSGRINNPEVLYRGPKPYVSIDFEHNKPRDHNRGGEPEGDPVSEGLQRVLSVKADPFLEELMDKAWRTFLDAVNTRLASFNCGACFLTVTEYI